MPCCTSFFPSGAVPAKTVAAGRAGSKSSAMSDKFLIVFMALNH
jgi:hypothetical protein